MGKQIVSILKSRDFGKYIGIFSFFLFLLVFPVILLPIPFFHPFLRPQWNTPVFEAIVTENNLPAKCRGCVFLPSTFFILLLYSIVFTEPG